MKIVDLGDLYGDLIVFGGVYSNLHALEAMIDYACDEEIPASNVICTGDIVAYCAYAEQSVEAIRGFGCPTIAGNCEIQLAASADDCGCGFEEGSTCSLLSRSWYAHANSQISDASRGWMGVLPDRIVFKHQGLKYAVVHGGASDISKFLWSVSPMSVFQTEISLLEKQVGPIDRVLSGHSGIPLIKDIDTKKWINAGAIGLPANDGDLDTNFARISETSININKLYYDIEAAFQAMQACSLTQGYHAALKTGYWPSEDVLPNELRVQSANG